MYCSVENRDRGFTLVELLMAMAILGIIFAALASTFVIQSRSYDLQEQVTEMTQTARAAMDMMTREIRMAGCNPAGAVFNGITYNASQLQIRMDLTDASGNPGSDGATTGPNENIIYTYDAANLRIDRNTGASAQPFAENIQSFTFSYLDSDGNATTATADIRQVSIAITARTAKPDSNGTFRTYTLSSLVTPPNLYL